MGTTTGSSGMAEPTPTPKPKRVNKLVEAINKASESEVLSSQKATATITDEHIYVPSPQESAIWVKKEQVKHDRVLFRESLKAFIVALEVKHPAHIGAAVALADEYVKVVNMRYPLDLS
jgi:hypothetical protein